MSESDPEGGGTDQKNETRGVRGVKELRVVDVFLGR